MELEQGSYKDYTVLPSLAHISFHSSLEEGYLSGFAGFQILHTLIRRLFQGPSEALICAVEGRPLFKKARVRPPSIHSSADSSSTQLL